MQAASTSDPAAPKLQRLPVNPRRNKVLPEQRKRVVRACNACNVRRVRCTGGQPCQRCAKVNRQCEYPAPESDKTALKDEVERLRRHCADLEAQLGSIMPDASTASNSSNLHSDGLNLRRTAVPLRVASGGDQFRAIEQGCMLKDDWNHSRFLGETSGATFLDRLKNFMWGLVPLTFPDDSDDGSKFVKSVGRYQTYDSRTLPDPEVELHELPDPKDMIAMLTDLRNCVQDGENDVHSGGIFWWGDLTSLPPNIPKPTGQDITNIVEQDTRYQVLAFPNACFALAIAISHTTHPSTREFGYACFKRARALVRNPLNTVNFTLSDVPTFTMMAFYLIEVNRRDAAYMYMSFAAHIAIIHGSFRIERDEASKRNMWTLYILDRWLSVLMGRPPVIADEAITIAPPSDAPGLPSPVGLRAHVELSEIAGYIVCDTYKIAPRHKPTGESARETTYYMDQALKFLEDWRTQLPEELRISNPQQQPGPACLMLHMRYNQLVVLTTRPVFFAAVKRAVANQVFPEKSSKAIDHELRYIEDCAAAAHDNILLAKRVLESNGRLLQAGLHLTFNAAVVLLLNSIMAISCCGGSKDEVLSASTLSSCEIDLAISIFKQEKETGTAYHRDCHDVLKDLKALKERYQAYKQGPTDSAFAFDEAVFEDLQDWIQEDGLGLQDTLLI